MKDSHHYVWILNPDAEREVLTSGDYTPPQARRAHMDARRAQFSALTRDEPAFFLHELPPASQFSAPPRPLFWSPTPTAVRLAERRGYSVPAQPAPSLIRQVLGRDLLERSALPGPSPRYWARSAQELQAALKQLTEGQHWRSKRLYSAAGRGQRRIQLPLICDDEKFFRDSLRQGGLLLEPELSVQAEYSIHGCLRGDRLFLGQPCALLTDAYFAPSQITPLSDCPSALHTTLTRYAEQAAEQLRDLGYWGPFGLDILAVAAPDSSELLWVSDFNCRFTLGWSVGLGAQREAALALILDT